MATLPAARVGPDQLSAASTSFKKDESTVTSPKRLARIVGVLAIGLSPIHRRAREEDRRPSEKRDGRRWRPSLS